MSTHHMCITRNCNSTTTGCYHDYNVHASEFKANAFKFLHAAFLCQSKFQYILQWSILQMPAQPQNIPRVCSKTSKSYLKGSRHSRSPKSYQSFQVTRVSGDLSKCVLITSPGHWLDTSDSHFHKKAMHSWFILFCQIVSRRYSKNS